MAPAHVTSARVRETSDHTRREMNKGGVKKTGGNNGSLKQIQHETDFTRGQ